MSYYPQGQTWWQCVVEGLWYPPGALCACQQMQLARQQQQQHWGGGSGGYIGGGFGGDNFVGGRFGGGGGVAVQGSAASGERLQKRDEEDGERRRQEEKRQRTKSYHDFGARGSSGSGGQARCQICYNNGRRHIANTHDTDRCKFAKPKPQPKKEEAVDEEGEKVKALEKELAEAKKKVEAEKARKAAKNKKKRDGRAKKAAAEEKRKAEEAEAKKKAHGEDERKEKETAEAEEAGEAEDQAGTAEEWRQFSSAFDLHRAVNPGMADLEAARAFEQSMLYEAPSGEMANRLWRRWARELIKTYEDVNEAL